MDTVYIGRDNYISWLLKTNGAAQDLTGVNKMVLCFPEGLDPITSFNGDTDPIRWAKDGYATGEVRLFLGTYSPVITGSAQMVYLDVYSITNPDGVCWGRMLFNIVSGA